MPLPLSLCHSNTQVKCSCRLLYIIRVSKAQAAWQEKWALSDSSFLSSHGWNRTRRKQRGRAPSIGAYTACVQVESSLSLSQSLTNHPVNQVVYAASR